MRRAARGAALGLGLSVALISALASPSAAQGQGGSTQPDSGAAQTSTRAETLTLPCPVGGDAGATVTVSTLPAPRQIGLRMDLRPISAEPQRPLPLLLEECDGNGLVLFQDQFTPAEVEALTALVSQDAYKALKDAGHARGFRAAWLLENMGETNPDTFAYYLLLAAWEVEGQDLDLHKTYLERAVIALNETLATKEDVGERQFTQLLIANLLRRANLMDQAVFMAAQVPADDPESPPSVRAYRAKLIELLGRREIGPRTFMRET